jgi:hypothetical protein
MTELTIEHEESIRKAAITAVTGRCFNNYWLN